MANRINGQIWIDKNSPYRLKYFTEDSEYEVNVSQIFEGDSDEAEELSMGMVVAVTDKGKLKRAVFPDDIERVIGVLGSKRKVDDPDGSYHYNVSISVADKLELSKEDVANSFVDINESLSKAGSAQKLLGAPIYWYIGRQKKSGDTFTYEDSNSYKGMVTFNTPSGYQWGLTNITEDCFNIGYDNLPIIGTVSNIVYDNGTVTKLTLNTNFHGFDKTIGWSFPYTDNIALSRGVLTPTYNSSEGCYSASIDIMHGLFPNSPTVKARCYCDVIAMDYPNEDPEQTADTEYRVSAIVDNFYDKRELENASGERHTHIEVHTPDIYRYNIHGTVVYKFQKGVN
jgi:hypothetical protein